MTWEELIADSELYKFAVSWAKKDLAPKDRPWKVLALQIGDQARKSIDAYRSEFEPNPLIWPPEIDYNKLHKESRRQIDQLDDAIAVFEDLDTVRDLVFCIATLRNSVPADHWDDDEEFIDKTVLGIEDLSRKIRYYRDVLTEAYEAAEEKLPSLNEWRQRRIEQKRKIYPRDPHTRGVKALRDGARLIWTKSPFEK
jgi:hypothetical protein